MGVKRWGREGQPEPKPGPSCCRRPLAKPKLRSNCEPENALSTSRSQSQSQSTSLQLKLHLHLNLIESHCFKAATEKLLSFVCQHQQQQRKRKRKRKRKSRRRRKREVCSRGTAAVAGKTAGGAAGEQKVKWISVWSSSDSLIC